MVLAATCRKVSTEIELNPMMNLRDPEADSKLQIASEFDVLVDFSRTLSLIPGRDAYTEVTGSVVERRSYIPCRRRT